jgi:hypothetical protein
VTQITPLQTELIREEVNQLLFLADRHQRWFMQLKDYDDRRRHRQVCDELRGLANEIDRIFFKDPYEDVAE